MKNKLLITALILISVIGLQNAVASGDIESPQRIITVQGVGSVSAAPDIVRLNLGVQTRNKDLSSAIRENEQRIRAVIDVIEDYDISDADYSTSNFSVYYQQPYGAEISPEEGTYNVNNNIYIEIKEISIIGDFIQDALKAGANQFYGLEYAISDPEPLMKKARELAVRNAAELAGETASYANLSIGEIISIEESPRYGGGPFLAERSTADFASNSITTIPGEKTVEVQVSIVYSLK